MSAGEAIIALVVNGGLRGSESLSEYQYSCKIQRKLKAYLHSLDSCLMSDHINKTKPAGLNLQVLNFTRCSLAMMSIVLWAMMYNASCHHLNFISMYWSAMSNEIPTDSQSHYIVGENVPTYLEQLTIHFFSWWHLHVIAKASTQIRSIKSFASIFQIQGDSFQSYMSTVASNKWWSARFVLIPTFRVQLKWSRLTSCRVAMAEKLFMYNLFAYVGYW